MKPNRLHLASTLVCALSTTGCWGQGPTTFDAGRSPVVETAVLRSDTGDPIADIVKVRLNGERQAWMLLDSGAEVSILDSALASTLELERIGSAGAGECGIRVPIERGRLLEAGTAVTRDPVFGVLDLGATGLLEGLVTPPGVRIAGVLGAPLFEVALVEIDYAKEREGNDRVSIHDPRSFELTRGSWTPVRVREGRPVIEATYNGDVTAWFHLDTGKTETVSFFSSHWVPRNLLAGKTPGSRANRRLCGEVNEHVATLDSFELGGRGFEAPLAAFKPAGSPGDEPIAGEAGNLGQGFLRAFTLVVDLPHNRVALLEWED